MGAGREGLAGTEREKGPSRAARWAEERNELISDTGMVPGRGGEQQQQFAETGIVMPTGEIAHQNQSRLASSKAAAAAASRTGPKAPLQTSAMDVDEETLVPSAPEWVGEDATASSPSRDVVVYSPEDSPGRLMAGARGNSGRGKSPTLTRIRSSPPIMPLAEEQEQNVQELRHSRSTNSSSRRPKSPRSPRKSKPVNPSAPPEFSQSRLRQSTLRSRGQSPRRTRVDEDELQDVLAEIIHDQSLTLARAARRQSKLNRSHGTNRDGQEGAVSNDQPSSGRVSPGRPPLGGSIKAVGSSESPEESPGKPGRKTKTRRQKRKADAVPDSLPDDSVVAEMVHHRFHPLQGLQDFVSRAATRKAKANVVCASRAESSSTSNTWMELFADVIMWRDVPRSTLLFGAGCFCILSASFIRDVRCGSLTFTAYIALVYLAAVFLHRNFLRGSATAHESRNWELGEAEALDTLRVILPAMNLVLEKCGQLFCGDPSTTLKVASVLWLLAQAGYFMTIWSLLRFGFLLMFIVPKLYSCYSHQLHGRAEAFADRLWSTWNAYAHKKAAVFGTLVVAWNLSSATSRLYGAFLLLVAIKLYSHHCADQVKDQMETDEPLPVSEQPEEN